MTTSIVFCRDCKYEPISFNKQACPQCGGRNFEARYAVSQPVSQAEALEPTITLPRILLERILAEYLVSEREHWETNGEPEDHVYHALAELAQSLVKDDDMKRAKY